jgi:hypothetical protein
MTGNTQLTSALDQINMDVNVDMSSVVAIFVAKHEKLLYEQKAELTEKIKKVKKELAAVEEKVVEGVDKTKYEVKIEVLGISFAVTGVRADFTKEPKISVVVEGSDYEDTGRYRSSLSKIINIDVPADLLAEHQQLTSQLDLLTEELAVVLAATKSMGRKVREITGAIAERKLESQGMTALLQDPEMLKMIKM